ncbi:TetR/AcrR family transcriptional regulator [Gracilibacillus sp. S3-1-1]|uniref:TetR/AcrR family transcriptional regulator n=1 Tax=Gracilibacillus pellucidus TaxID=3095368 RepID=A0ACC6M4L9_9BACI|nr:TetR/AcrR family transcriptional regulator [Gracilibacillus sp. S3-1-1]MDX8045848.1 TetR/AcrR family transcriptional regulator [Gracilibacillus sp. S3-1-1]
MGEKLDRRKKYTRMVLKDSLVQLMNEKSFSSITVKEVCLHADINRSTFYTHFTDVENLLFSIEEEIITEMNRSLEALKFAKEEESIKMTEKLLEYVQKHKEIFEALLENNTGTSFEKRVMDIAKICLLDSTPATNTDAAAYLSTFMISGSVHVIKDWLFNEKKQTPKQMAELISEFTNKGLGALNV